MTMPLEGIRVLDWTQGIQGPFAAQSLADLGAEVIKIEDPVRGDFIRGQVTVWGVPAQLPNGHTFHFESNNRNKRGIAVNLQTEAGREIVYRLVREADVFVRNYGNRVAAALGMDYETLSQYNPRLIYGSGSGYGERGPDAELSALDLGALARSGIMMDSADEEPVVAFQYRGFADRVSGIVLAYQLVVALLARERYGIGQEVHSSLLGGVAILDLRLQSQLMVGKATSVFPRGQAPNPLYNFYKCKDGVWIALLQNVAPGEFWRPLCAVLGRPELTAEPRFSTWTKWEEHPEEAIAILDQLFAARTYGEWAGILSREMPRLLFARVNAVEDAVSDPQMIANGYIADFDHPDFGPMKVEGIVAHLSKTPGALRRPAPKHGQHTEEVLLELGYSWDEIIALKEQGVIV